MKPIILIAILTYIVVPRFSQAEAQATESEGGASGSTYELEAPLTTDEPYSPRKALAWSLTTTLVGTAAGIGLFIPGLKQKNSLFWVGLGIAGIALTIGPSTGIYYANRPLRASITLAVRALIVGGWICWLAYDLTRPEGSWAAMPPISLFLVLPPVAIATIILVLNDIASAPHCARKSNEELTKKNRISLVPALFRARNGARVPGLAIGGEF